MSRELPYFKFFTSEWLNGNVTLEDYELQGLFINVCAFYWHKDCKLEHSIAEKKFRGSRLQELIDAKLITLDNGNLIISFLDEQNLEFVNRKERLSQAGQKGAKIKAEKNRVAEILVELPTEEILTTLQPPLVEIVNHSSTTREDKIREEQEQDKIIQKLTDLNNRKLKFSQSLETYLDKYGRTMINEFYIYWTEENRTQTKMKFELQKTWSIAGRLTTWSNNQKKFNNGKSTNTQESREDALRKF